MNCNIAKIKNILNETGADAAIISSCNSVSYLSMFRTVGESESDARLLIMADKQYIITDSRYVVFAKTECSEYTLVEGNSGDLPVMEQLIKENGIKSVLYENESITLHMFKTYFELLQKSGIDLIPFDNKILKLREIKEQYEIDNIQKACDISCEALRRTLPTIRVGVTEKEVAATLEYNMRMCGGDGVAFPTIVVSGKKSALPHGMPSEKTIEKGDPVTIDFGATYNGYCADMTRTFFVGEPSAKMREIYEVVYKAQTTAIAEYKTDCFGSTTDDIARKIISSAGYGDNFGHGLGHGVGIEVHELPRVSPRNTSSLVSSNMVFSIEPGIYVENLGGVRIEDLVYDDNGKIRIFTNFPKELTVL